MQRRKKAMKSAFVVTVAAAAMACGGKAVGDGTGPGGGEGPGITNPPGPTMRTTCTTATKPGDPCGLGESGECSNNFNHVSLVCVNGSWTPQVQPPTNPPGPMPECMCPTDPPQGGTSCAASCQYPAQCTYMEGTGCPPVVATCEVGKWNVLITSCNPPPPDAGAD